MITHRQGWIGLGVSISAYIVLFFAMYPPLSGIEDEVGFVNQSMVWSRGVISSEAAGFPQVTDFGKPGESPHLVDFVPVADRHLPGRHPGRSLILLPFLFLGGVQAGFLSGLLIHVAVTMVAAFLFVRFGRSPAWALLVLFHPTLSLYSRTIMADEVAGGFLLLAALLSTYHGRQWSIASGLAVGLAALMRYHAGLGLLVIAGAIALDRQRPRRHRDGLICLLVGGLCGMVLIVYNLSLYHSALDPVGGPRGQFGVTFLAENVPFYVMALMAIWPGMLLAPLFDRSPFGGIARGLCGLFHIFFCVYYFHDRGGSFAETLVLGLRLIQVALPIWIVSYGLVIDTLVKAFRNRYDARGLSLVAWVSGAFLIVVTGQEFSQHQKHLRILQSVREAMVERISTGSVVVTHGSSYKLFGIPSEGPVYRWLMLSADDTVYDHSSVLDHLREPWYLAVLSKGDPTLPPAAKRLITEHAMQRVEKTPSALILYRSDPSSRVGP